MLLLQGRRNGKGVVLLSAVRVLCVLCAGHAPAQTGRPALGVGSWPGVMGTMFATRASFVASMIMLAKGNQQQVRLDSMDAPAGVELKVSCII